MTRRVWCRCPVDNTESTFGMTPLDMAVLMGDVESTAQLLAAGADPDHLLKLFALTDLYDVTVIHPDRKKTRELLDDDDKVRCFCYCAMAELCVQYSCLFVSPVGRSVSRITHERVRRC